MKEKKKKREYEVVKILIENFADDLAAQIGFAVACDVVTGDEAWEIAWAKIEEVEAKFEDVSFKDYKILEDEYAEKYAKSVEEIVKERLNETAKSR